MLTNQTTFKKLWRSGILTSVMLASLWTHPSLAQTKSDKDFEKNEKESRLKRQEYFEKIHRSAPNTNYKAIDDSTRYSLYEDYKKARKAASKSRITATETFANGAITAEWIEKGSNNQAGRIKYADLWAATNTVYAVSDGGNVWKADINGSNWICLNNALKLKGSNYIKVVANGTGKRIIVGTDDKHVYYSDDDGATWSQATGLSTVQNWGWVMKTIVLQDSPKTVFLLAAEWDNGVYASVYRSTDKGASFTRIRRFLVNYDNGDQQKFSIWAPSTSHTTAYLINPDSVFTMSPTASVNAVQGTYKHNLPIANNLRFAGGKSGSSVIFYIHSNTTIYRSADGGSTWLTLNAPNGNNTFSTYSLSASINDPNAIYWGDIECYKGVFSNNLISWTKINGWVDYYSSPSNKLHADIPTVASVLTSSNAEYQLICTDGGVYTSTNNLSTVTNISLTGLNNSQYYSVYTVRNNLNYIYAGSQDQGFQQATTDAGGICTFTQLFSGDDGRSVTTDNNSFWHTSYANVHYFPNAQNASLNYWYSLDGVGRLWMPFILEHPTNSSMMYMGGGKTSTDQTAKILQFTYNGTYGISKTALPYDFAALSGCHDISAIGISKINNNYWYVLTDNGKFFSSSDGGNNFSMNTTFSGISGHFFYGSSILVSKQQIGTIYVAGSGYSNPGVYRSTDHGQTFTAITNGLPSTLLLDLTANVDESLIFAATEVGPYVYVVADNQWYPIRGLSGPDQLYWDVEFISSTNTVRYATYGRGVWDFKMQSTGSNQPPVVSITSPANNASYTEPASVSISANASDPDGSVSKVEFYNGSQYLGEDNSAPYTYTWTNVSAGTYTITAKVYDNLNLSVTSSPVSITVTQGSSCTAAQWSSSAVYVNGNIVQYNGIKYFANYWNQNQRPDLYNGGAGSGQPWTSQGTCTSRISNSYAETLTMVPNPVDNSSAITINLEESDAVELYVIDHLGRRVAEVFNGTLSEGSHIFDLNSSSFSSGVYNLIMKGEKGNIALRFIKK